MKNPKKPTRDQKRRIHDAGLNWNNWLVSSETGSELRILHKKSGKSRVITK